jgi:membrane protease YdiL (CAAX protease family)
LPTWLDLILYLLLGGGGFVAASIVAHTLLGAASLPVSIAAYVVNFLAFAGAFYLVGVRRGRIDLRASGLVPPRLSLYWLATGFSLSLVLIPLRGVTALAVQTALGENLNALDERLGVLAPGGFTWPTFLITLVGAGILAPVAEELFFRGALYPWFRRRFGVTVGVLASSLLFSLGHIDTAGVAASAFVLGAANALVYERSKTLWAPIVMHMTTNVLAVLIIYSVLAFAPQMLRP